MKNVPEIINLLFGASERRDFNREVVRKRRFQEKSVQKAEISIGKWSESIGKWTERGDP